jgi:hypothetical protein
MDFDDVVIYQRMLDEMNYDADVDAERHRAGSAFAIIVLGVVESRRLRSERRQPNRLYLCRPQLLRRPR